MMKRKSSEKRCTAMEVNARWQRSVRAERAREEAARERRGWTGGATRQRGS
jgi:hypothetical protein